MNVTNVEIKSTANTQENLSHVNVVLFPWIKPDITLGILVIPKTLNKKMNKLELIEELRKIDEITLMELLELTSIDIVDAFLEKIDDHQVRLTKAVNDT